MQRLLDCDTIKIMVGEDDDAKTFFVHEALARARSPYIDTALKDCRADGNGELSLAAFDDDAFAVIMTWMYPGRIPDSAFCWDQNDFAGNIGSVYQLAQIPHVYSFLDLCMDKLIHTFDKQDRALTMFDLVEFLQIGLSETALFQFTLKKAIYTFMRRPHLYKPSEDVDLSFSAIYDDPGMAKLVLEQIKLYAVKPWVPQHNRKKKCRWHEHQKSVQCYLKPIVVPPHGAQPATTT